MEFFSLRVSQEAIEGSIEINQLNKLEVWNNLHRTGSSQSQYPLLEKQYTYSQIPPAHIGRVIPKSNYDFERTEDVKQYMLEKLGIQIPY